MATRSGNRAGSKLLHFEEMSRTERVMAAVRGEPVDRLPVCFWHHFQPAGSGRKLADASLRFFDEVFDLDILKIMPDIPYPFPRQSIQSLDDWRLIEPIDQERSRYFAQRAEAVRVLRDELGARRVEAAIGPGIGACCYEVGEEVLERFRHVSGAVRGRHLDLRAVTDHELRVGGVADVQHVDHCTSCRADLYFSHRRDGGVTGRQGGLVVLDA